MKYSERVKTVFSTRLKANTALFSFWTHFPEFDLNPVDLARASVEFQKEYDLDFLKTMPNGMYAIEDYGAKLNFADVAAGGVAKVVETPFMEMKDWDKLRPANATKGALAREIESFRRIREALPTIPVLFTVFSPMTIADKLSCGRIVDYVRDRANRSTLHKALSMIAGDVAALCEEAIALGADGVFFAHQDTDRDKFSYDDFSEFVQAYDMEALAGARNGRFNVLHLHGESIRFFELEKYPVDAINWHLWETCPNAKAVRNSTNKCIVGGINRWSVTNNDRKALEKQIDDTLSVGEEMGNVILTPGCTIRHGFDPETLHYLRNTIRNCHAAREVAKRNPFNRCPGPIGRIW